MGWMARKIKERNKMKRLQEKAEKKAETKEPEEVVIPEKVEKKKKSAKK